MHHDQKKTLIKKLRENFKITPFDELLKPEFNPHHGFGKDEDGKSYFWLKIRPGDTNRINLRQKKDMLKFVCNFIEKEGGSSKKTKSSSKPIEYVKFIERLDGQEQFFRSICKKLDLEKIWSDEQAKLLKSVAAAEDNVVFDSPTLVAEIQKMVFKVLIPADYIAEFNNKILASDISNFDIISFFVDIAEQTLDSLYKQHNSVVNGQKMLNSTLREYLDLQSVGRSADQLEENFILDLKKLIESTPCTEKKYLEILTVIDYLEEQVKQEEKLIEQYFTLKNKFINASKCYYKMFEYLVTWEPDSICAIMTISFAKYNEVISLYGNPPNSEHTMINCHTQESVGIGKVNCMFAGIQPFIESYKKNLFSRDIEVEALLQLLEHIESNFAIYKQKQQPKRQEYSRQEIDPKKIPETIVPKSHQRSPHDYALLAQYNKSCAAHDDFEKKRAIDGERNQTDILSLRYELFFKKNIEKTIMIDLACPDSLISNGVFRLGVLKDVYITILNNFVDEDLLFYLDLIKTRPEKILKRNSHGETGIKIHNPDWLSVKITNSPHRLICVKATHEDFQLFFPYKLLDHKAYELLINSRQRFVDEVQKAAAGIKIIKHSFAQMRCINSLTPAR